MEVKSIKLENMSLYGKKSACLVVSAHIKITNIEDRASEMITVISDTSWINKLGAVEKVTFNARAKRTIIKLVECISNRLENEMTTEFGEFMVSESAQSFLSSNRDHKKIPLAELLKEKVSGNPGFDFHTESDTNLIAFGEAKYSGSTNPHSKALNQIADFIELEKDSAELNTLQAFVTDDAITNAINGKRAYVAAFSINGENPEAIIENALKSDVIDSLLDFPEIYVIGIEVDA